VSTASSAEGSAASLASWREAVAAGTPPAPTVLVLGGFITSPPMYRAFRRDLLARGAADVVVANVWTMDWLLAAARGLGPILTRSGRALLEASERAEAASMGAPVLVIGHSAAGVSARLLTSPEPFAGRRLNAAGRIGAIVTLGTPHMVAEPGPGRRKLGAENALFANQQVPGGFFAPTTGYFAVGSRAHVGRRAGSLNERRWWRGYAGLLGTDEPVIEGDGLIPLRAALLPGVAQLVLDECSHGQGSGGWYGTPRFLDQWLPRALEIWQSALRARVERG
jgi:hypothetical protein